ncbi:ribosome-inactivating family protein [Streptomyces sp. NPDC007100]|uniref:ribosome-inactivating family protein n=1 Tax=Streptomyces sp. NPDC007100 TaxID=3155602 RepID=UPI0033D2ED05
MNVPLPRLLASATLAVLFVGPPLATAVAAVPPAPPAPRVSTASAAAPAVHPNPSLPNLRTAGSGAYRAFVKALRLRATDGQVFYRGMYRTRPAATNDLFPVHLRTSTNVAIDLVVRASNLYVVGWYLPATNTFWALQDTPAPHYSPNPNTTRESVGFDGNYGTLQRKAGTTRGDVGLNRAGLDQAAIDLARASDTGQLNGRSASRALLTLVQDTSEAARFTKIEDLIARKWTGTTEQRPFITALENDWDAFSTWAINKHKGAETRPHSVYNITVATLADAQKYLSIVNMSRESHVGKRRHLPSPTPPAA